jgi:hypothetical protein
MTGGAQRGTKIWRVERDEPGRHRGTPQAEGHFGTVSYPCHREIVLEVFGFMDDALTAGDLRNVPKGNNHAVTRCSRGFPDFQN